MMKYATLLILLIACSTPLEIPELWENTLTSPACTSLLRTVATIDGTAIDNRAESVGSGAAPDSQYTGLRTKDNCIFYVKEPFNAPPTYQIGVNTRITGAITPRNLAYVGTIFIITPNGSTGECSPLPPCPQGTNSNIIRRYQGGSLYGCPAEQECR